MQVSSSHPILYIPKLTIYIIQTKPHAARQEPIPRLHVFKGFAICSSTLNSLMSRAVHMLMIFVYQSISSGSSSSAAAHPSPVYIDSDSDDEVFKGIPAPKNTKVASKPKYVSCHPYQCCAGGRLVVEVVNKDHRGRRLQATTTIWVPSRCLLSWLVRVERFCKY